MVWVTMYQCSFFFFLIFSQLIFWYRTSTIWYRLWGSCWCFSLSHLSFMIIFHILTYLIFIWLQMTIWGTSDTLLGFLKATINVGAKIRSIEQYAALIGFFLVIFLLSRIFWEKYIKTDEGEIRLKFMLNWSKLMFP